VILGTNQYANPLESISQNIEKSQGFIKDEPSAYKKLKIYRGARAFEEVRLATEAAVAGGKKKPSVFLLTIGNPGMRKARATFATNFFGCAGYAILDNAGFKSVEEGIKAALESNSEIIVLCSSDEEYAAIAPAACKGIKSVNKDAKIFVAGYPKEQVDLLKSNGVDDFIHMRTNVLEFLSDLQKEFGIL
jgi:methylmalonyl-CoA mutase